MCKHFDYAKELAYCWLLESAKQLFFSIILFYESVWVIFSALVRSLTIFVGQSESCFVASIESTFIFIKATSIFQVKYFIFILIFFGGILCLDFRFFWVYEFFSIAQNCLPRTYCQVLPCIFISLPKFLPSFFEWKKQANPMTEKQLLTWPESDKYCRKASFISCYWTS